MARKYILNDSIKSVGFLKSYLQEQSSMCMTFFMILLENKK